MLNVITVRIIIAFSILDRCPYIHASKIDATTEASDGSRSNFNHIPDNLNLSDFKIKESDLNETYPFFYVNWDDSDVVVGFAKQFLIKPTSPFAVYASYDGGETFKNITSKFVSPGNVFISKYYVHPSFRKSYVFTDVTNKYIHVSTDSLKNVKTYKLNFSPSKVFFVKDDENAILIQDLVSQNRELYVSENFGATFRQLESHVKQVFFQISGNIQRVLLLRNTPDNLMSVVPFNIKPSLSKGKPLLSGVVKFYVYSDFCIASVPSQYFTGQLDLLVSHKNKPFVKAKFPSHLKATDFHVVDVVGFHIMLCVTDDNTETHLYISNSNHEHLSFYESLDRVLYYNPEKTNMNSVLKGVTKDVFADLHKVEGFEGIYIANRVKSGVNYKDVTPDKLTSYITFDKGGKWQLLSPPKVNFQGKPFDCQPLSNCSLHLTQNFHTLYPSLQSVPILSKKSAIGLIMASGSVGTSHGQGKNNVYISRDAGMSWSEVLPGDFLFNFGDHGGVITAVARSKSNVLTKSLLYSLDEGESWVAVPFSQTELSVHQLLTKPGEHTTIFSIFAFSPKLSWKHFKVDLLHAFDGICKDRDYKDWSPRDTALGRPCILGYKETFKRRMPSSKCYNGKDFDRPLKYEQCICSRPDYECDFGYKVDVDSGNCVLDPEDATVDVQIPLNCPAGGFFVQSKGYIKIMNDGCTDMKSDPYAPEMVPCPSRLSGNFLIIANGDALLKYDITSQTSQVIHIPNELLMVAVDYDIDNNCLYYSEYHSETIKALCLDGSPTSVIVEKVMVEGLAMDWITKNLYFTDRFTKTVQVVSVSNRTRTWRRVLIENLKTPRAIAVDPIKGFVFWTDVSNNKPHIGRCRMDGRDREIIVPSEDIGWPNGIALDMESETLYFTDSKLNRISRCKYDGTMQHVVMNLPNATQHSYSIGVLKNELFWNDWSAKRLFMADKATGLGTSSLLSLNKGFEIKVIASSLRQGSNGCVKSPCSHMCISMGAEAFKCLCSDKLLAETFEGEEKCVCPKEMAVKYNSTCVIQKCRPDQFVCNNKICVDQNTICNGVDDCGDGSDETQCCESDLFHCRNHKCIPYNWKCDGGDDCGDNSDEEHCDIACDGFKCLNNKCISQSFLCDGENDCDDNSDEFDCPTLGNVTCPPEAFLCSDNSCVSNSWVCDGSPDCKNGEDEVNCSSVECVAWQFKCDNGRCIYKHWVCDGTDDCRDNSDERNCTITSTPTPEVFHCEVGQFRCGMEEKCIDMAWKCDGALDCRDGSDEQGCSNSTVAPETSSTTSPSDKCEPATFMCFDHSCILQSWVCDGKADCSSGEDESNCPQVMSCDKTEFRCERDGNCLSLSKVCDNEVDCSDGTDEDGCSINHGSSGFICQLGHFMCQYSKCIPMSSVCDGQPNCPDGSDEIDCTDELGYSKYLQISDLMSDPKSINSSSFTITWQDANGRSKHEFLPTVSVADSEYWLNATWTTDHKYTFMNLLPWTTYKATVYLRDIKSSIIHQPVPPITVRTTPSVPSCPRDVQVVEMSNSGVNITWNPPTSPKGSIKGYQVLISPPLPVLKETTAELYFRITKNLIVGSMYNITVLADNSFFVSANCQPITFIYNEAALSLVIDKARFQTITDHDFSIKWVQGPPSVVYHLTCSSDNPFEPKLFLKTSDSTITISKRSPNTTYYLDLYACKEKICGTHEKSLIGHTLGTSIPPVYDVAYHPLHGTSFKLTWAPPKGISDAIYGIFYGRSMQELLLSGIRYETEKTFFELSRLEGCQEYVIAVIVVGPSGFGTPGGNYITLKTGFHITAPVKDIRVTRDPDNSIFSIIKWRSACDILPNNISYIVEIMELTTNRVDHKKLFASDKLHFSFRIRTHLGGHYKVNVRSDAPGALSSQDIYFSAPPMPVPHQVILTKSEDQNTLTWRDALSDSPHGVQYSVWISDDADDFSKALSFTVENTSFALPNSLQCRICYVAVSAQDSEGYSSDRSEVVIVIPSVSSHLVHNGLVSIVIAVLIIIVVVSGIVYIVFRYYKVNKRIPFINSHYNPALNSASLAPVDGLDDDSPMIRGFSDDEPLLVA